MAILKIVFIVYIIGFIISGAAALLSYQYQKFYQYQWDLTVSVMNEYQIPVTDEMVEKALKVDIKVTMFLSFIGLFRLAIYWIVYFQSKK